MIVFDAGQVTLQGERHEWDAIIIIIIINGSSSSSAGSLRASISSDVSRRYVQSTYAYTIGLQSVDHYHVLHPARVVPPCIAVRWSGPARMSKQRQTLKLAHLFSEYDERAALHC